MPGLKRQYGSEFQYFIFENAFGFAGAQKVDLKNQGLVCVVGKNLQETANGDASSGAGKTRMWTLFLYLFFGKQALSSAETVKDADIFGKDFRLESAFVGRDGGRYLVRETRRHSNPKFEEGLHVYKFVDGKWGPWEQAAKNDPKLLRAKLQQLLNLTYHEAAGTWIWPQGFGHALVDGKPTERVNFLSRLYGLTKYDEIYEQLDTMHKEVKNKISALVEFRSEYKLVEQSIQNAGDVTQIVQRGRVLSQKLKLLDAQIKTQREKSWNFDKRVTVLTELSDKLKQFSQFELSTQEHSLAVAGTLLEVFDKSCVTVEQTCAKYEDALQGLRQLADCRQRLKALGVVDFDTRKLHLEERRLIDVMTSLKPSQYDVTSVQQLEDGANVFKGQIKELALKLNTRPIDSIVQETLKQEQATLQEMTATMQLLDGQRADLDGLRAKLVVHDGECRCPMCKSLIDHKRIDTMLKNLVARLNTLDEQLLPHEDRVDDLEKLLDLLSKFKALRTEAISARAGLADAEKLDQIDRRLVVIRRQLALADQHRELTSEAKKLETGYGRYDLSKMQIGYDRYHKLIERNQSKRSTYYEIVGVVSSLKAVANGVGVEDPFAFDPATEAKKLAQQRERLELWLADATHKYENGRTQLERYRQIVTDYREKKNHLDELKAQMDELKRLEEREYVIANTKPAYAKDGLKMQYLHKLLAQLNARLPHWTRILFTDKNFVVKVKGDSDGKGLNLVVPKTFKIGNKTKTHDVDISCLSGGERSRMAICLMLTMAELTSREKRANFQVLDEVDRHLDPHSQRLMADILIQSLRKIKPSLFLISHSTFVDPKTFDRRLIVTKDKNSLSSVKTVENTRRTP
jgi:DNA repair exonuclease SbcCD ATPase subunit